MLELYDVTKAYQEDIAVNQISFRVKKGIIYGVLGPNGAGKTTLLSMIVGLLKADKGKILLEGMDSQDDSIEYKKRIGFVPDPVNLYDYLTGREYIEFLANLRDVPKDMQNEQISRLTRIFRLEHKIDHFIKTYSKGMRQKVAIIAALVHKPKLLVLDEPFSGLDPNALKEMKEYLQEYVKSGNSILFSTHILEIVENLCEELMIIKQGNIVTAGNMKGIKSKLELSEDAALEDIFYQTTSDH